MGFTFSSDPDDVSSCPSSLVGDECCDEEQRSPVREHQRCDALCASDRFNKSGHRAFSYSTDDKKS